MHLKSLELLGFKSFAKKTILEFPKSITAIVGPNGSGKSNIKEAVQWALGEQSLKSLRGRKGEDLIWNGSERIAKAGKAIVTLIFDNCDYKAPIEFEELTISRKIFRDGTGEYQVNGTIVRLKDVIELAAKMGLGETKHNIIGQGEIDRVLISSPQERKEMLEEALGLRIYRLKKCEAERKLSTTRANSKQIEALIKEISPHLRFLKGQVARAEERKRLEEELSNLQKRQLYEEMNNIERERKDIEIEQKPFDQQAEKIKKEIEELNTKIEQQEKLLDQKIDSKKEDEQRLRLEGERQNILREIGRLEGRIEMEKSRLQKPKFVHIDFHTYEGKLSALLVKIKEAVYEENNILVIRRKVDKLVQELGNIFAKLKQGPIQEEWSKEDLSKTERLKNRLQELQNKLSTISEEIKNLQESSQDKDNRHREIFNRIREYDSKLRQKREEERKILLEKQRILFRKEKLEERIKEFNLSLKRLGLKKKDIINYSRINFYGRSGPQLIEEINKIKARLEQIGIINPELLEEYKEIQKRHSHLTQELEDLRKADESLRLLINSLEKKIAQIFREGFEKINKEFNHYFKLIFNGGKAQLNIVKTADDTDNDNKELEQQKRKTEGIELSVSLPQKRIRGLAMLSGGERALSSIALLFAIVSVNPPPFLILDETDAALDEANSQKYAAILKELAKKTQLILITHNRETMKAADVLYGITMSKEGASQLLSLKFEEAESYTNR